MANVRAAFVSAVAVVSLGTQIVLAQDISGIEDLRSGAASPRSSQPAAHAPAIQKPRTSGPQRFRSSSGARGTPGPQASWPIRCAQCCSALRTISCTRLS